MIRKTLLFLLLSLVTAMVTAAEEKNLQLPNGDEVSATRYPAEGNRLLLWLPSEFGLSPRQVPTARVLATQGIEVWIPDLHSAWFVPPGRYSLNDIDPGAIESLIDILVKRGKQVFLLTSGRTTALALRALHRYQADKKDTRRIRGLISIGPRLFLRTPQGGEAPEFLPIASASNVPTYILQPQNTGGFWRVAEVVETLEQGGAPVFTQVLQDVRDGFNLRSEFTPTEQAITGRLPGILINAMNLLDGYGGLPPKPAPLAGVDRAPQGSHATTLLHPYTGKAQTPDLNLPQLDGGKRDLGSLKGKVLLVNFWATWCPPCVEEIPSLQRLYEARKAQGLEILAVDVGEPREQVAGFLADKPVSFPVLLDSEGVQLKHWGVHAFPTTFILDRTLRIRYAGFGAFAWDSAEVLKTLDALLSEPQ